MAKAKTETAEVVVVPLQRASIRLRLIGTTPLIQNRMANKAQRVLLVGGQTKGKADRANIKHDPPNEYRNAAQMLPGPAGPTALAIKAVAIKAAMCTAALDTTGANKTESQRLLFLPAQYVPVYGTPQLYMTVVRSADFRKTPDIRTRPLLQRWGAEVELQYIVPQFSANSVITLLCNAGITVGVGDGRQEKGSLHNGCFRVVTSDQPDAEWDDLVANHGRDAQLKALDDPEYADEETVELMEFYLSEIKRRKA